MWPMLKRDGQGLQYVTLTLLWNYLIGYNPLALQASFVQLLSLVHLTFLLFQASFSGLIGIER